MSTGEDDRTTRVIGINKDTNLLPHGLLQSNRNYVAFKHFTGANESVCVVDVLTAIDRIAIDDLWVVRARLTINAAGSDLRLHAPPIAASPPEQDAFDVKVGNVRQDAKHQKL